MSSIPHKTVLSTPAAKRAVVRWVLTIGYLAAGLLHIARPEAFLPIVPGWVPLPRLVVVATGWFEIVAAIGLAWPRWRKAAGLGLAAYAVAVFPANIHHAMTGVVLFGIDTGWAYHAPRLTAQPLIVWGALYASGWIGASGWRRS